MVNGNSKYANAMNDAQVTGVGCAIPNALVEMLDALAKTRGFTHRNGLIRSEWISLVNGASMLHDDGTPWTYVAPVDAAAIAAQAKVSKLEKELEELKAKYAAVLPPTPPDEQANAETGEIESE